MGKRSGLPRCEPRATKSFTTPTFVHFDPFMSGVSCGVGSTSIWLQPTQPCTKHRLVEQAQPHHALAAQEACARHPREASAEDTKCTAWLL